MNNQKHEYSYLPDFLPEKVFRCPCLLYVVNKLLVAGIKGYRSICREFEQIWWKWNSFLYSRQ